MYRCEVKLNNMNKIICYNVPMDWEEVQVSSYFSRMKNYACGYSKSSYQHAFELLASRLKDLLFTKEQLDTLYNTWKETSETLYD